PFPVRMRLDTLTWEKRLMKRSSIRKLRKRRARARRLRARRISFHQALHQFLTAQVWKQGHQAWTAKHSNCSWTLKPILWVLLLMTWGKADSEAERFLQAWNFFVSRHRHEKRPGNTWEGFQQALQRVPMSVFRALSAGLRQEIGRRWIDGLRIGGWRRIGCHGSKLECPRSARP